MAELTGNDAAASQGVIVKTNNSASSEGSQEPSAPDNTTEQVVSGHRKVSSSDYGGRQY